MHLGAPSLEKPGHDSPRREKGRLPRREVPSKPLYPVVQSALSLQMLIADDRVCPFITTSLLGTTEKDRGFQTFQCRLGSMGYPKYMVRLAMEPSDIISRQITFRVSTRNFNTANKYTNDHGTVYCPWDEAMEIQYAYKITKAISTPYTLSSGGNTERYCWGDNLCQSSRDVAPMS